MNPVKNFATFRHKRKNKYNASRYVCRQGHRHDSIGEARYCDKLMLLKKAGEIKDYKNQVTFDLKVNGKKVTGHRVDFVVTNNDGSESVHEFKGYATQVWIIKRKLFIALYPQIPYKTIRG